MRCVDRARGRILGPHKYAQVMACGLLDKLKQPFYYDFDQSMSVHILKEIILKMTVDKIFVEQRLDKSVCDLKLPRKLTHHHLEVKGSGHQKVKTAA
ncbi:hypothetical protein PR048_019674 [Dryococelus australis]|uniref:Uncharacterized protein n=1 Tax=Dryococelus australis TaxID=614101 RepID=A0ABQ9H4H1_9NEOP|nr:hypothetical protein PR048_019674 [Dryococelus australis]